MFIGEFWVIALRGLDQAVVQDLMRSKTFAEERMRMLGLTNTEVRSVKVHIEWQPLERKP